MHWDYVCTSLLHAILERTWISDLLVSTRVNNDVVKDNAHDDDVYVDTKAIYLDPLPRSLECS